MGRKKAFGLFLAVVLLSILVQYGGYFKPGQSLVLSIFWDPTPRIGLYAWLVDSTRQLRLGHFPLWCNLEGAGMPLLANYQTAPLNPFNMVFEIFPSLRLLDYLLMLKLILLAIFTYGCAREFGRSELSAAVSSLAICFCGFLGANINHINLNVDLWLPLGLLLAERVFKYGATLARFTGLAAVSALALLAGNSQAAFYFLLFLMVFALIRGGWPARGKVFLILLGLGLGFALSAIMLFSFLEYLGFSWNYHERAIYSMAFFRSQDLFPVRGCFKLFFPWLFGPPKTMWDIGSSPGYIGLITLFLAGLTLPGLKRLGKSGLFFWIYALLAWGLIYDLPPFSLLGHLPILDRIRNPRHAYFNACFCLAMLSGLGLDRLSLRSVSRSSYGIVSGMVLMIALLSLAFAFSFPTHAPGTTVWSAGAVPLVLLLAAELAGLAGMILQRNRISSFLIALLAWANLIYLGVELKATNIVDPDIFRYRNQKVLDIYRPILRDKNPGRMVALSGALKPNLNVLFGINDFRGSVDGMYPAGYVQTLAAIYGYPMDEMAEKYIQRGWWFNLMEGELRHEWMDPAGVKYVISWDPLKIPGLKYLGSVQDYYCYQNPAAWPRTWLRSASGGIDFKDTLVTEYHPDQLTIIARGDGASDLVLADQYAPGWRARLEPQKVEARIMSEGGLFRRIALPKGQSEAKFWYQPWGFRIGLYSSLAGLAGLILAAGFILLNRVKMVKTQWHNFVVRSKL